MVFNQSMDRTEDVEPAYEPDDAQEDISEGEEVPKIDKLSASSRQRTAAERAKIDQKTREDFAKAAVVKETATPNRPSYRNKPQSEQLDDSDLVSGSPPKRREVAQQNFRQQESGRERDPIPFLATYRGGSRDSKSGPSHSSGTARHSWGKQRNDREDEADANMDDEDERNSVESDMRANSSRAYHRSRDHNRQAASPALSGYMTSSVRQTVKEMAQGKCWLCGFFGQHVAHTVSKPDNILFEAFQQQGLIQMDPQQSLENTMYLCSGCHSNFDERPPIWVFLPNDLEEFIENEEAFQNQRKLAAKSGHFLPRQPFAVDLPGASELGNPRKSQVQSHEFSGISAKLDGILAFPTSHSNSTYTRYQIRSGYMPATPFIENPTKRWWGNPMAAILRSASILSGITRLDQSTEGGVPSSVAEKLQHLLFLYGQPPPKVAPSKREVSGSHHGNRRNDGRDEDRGDDDSGNDNYNSRKSTPEKRQPSSSSRQNPRGGGQTTGATSQSSRGGQTRGGVGSTYHNAESNKTIIANGEELGNPRKRKHEISLITPDESAEESSQARNPNIISTREYFGSILDHPALANNTETNGQAPKAAYRKTQVVQVIDLTEGIPSEDSEQEEFKIPEGPKTPETQADEPEPATKRFRHSSEAYILARAEAERIEANRVVSASKVGMEPEAKHQLRSSAVKSSHKMVSDDSRRRSGRHEPKSKAKFPERYCGPRIRVCHSTRIKFGDIGVGECPVVRNGYIIKDPPWLSGEPWPLDDISEWKKGVEGLGGPVVRWDENGNKISAE